MAKSKKIKLDLTNEEAMEILCIIEACKDNLSLYDLDEDECQYKETYDDCEKWEDKFRDLLK